MEPGTPNPRREWQLWIDESGDFDDAEQDVVVAGLLVNAGAAEFTDRALRSALASAAPDCPWPLHAAALNSLCMYVLWPAERARSDGRELDPLTCEALDLLSHYANAALKRGQASVKSGREPCYDIRRELDRWLAQGPLSPALEERRRRVRTGIRAVVEAAGGAAGPQAAWCVAASESIANDARGEPLEERYLNLLACLLERVRDLLLELGGHHLVRVLASKRDVSSPNHSRTELQHRHIAWASVAAVWSPDLTVTIGDASVELRPCRTYAYDTAAPSPFVLADWIANGVLHTCARDWSLGRVTGSLRDSLRLPCEHTGLSTLAASGAPWRFTRAAERGDVGSKPRDGKRWTREQALAWSAALGRRGPR